MEDALPEQIQTFSLAFYSQQSPLRRNLSRRGMKIDTVCPVCLRQEEDGAHLFFKCKLARQVWLQLGLENKRADMALLDSPRDVTESILQQKEDTSVKMAITLWFLWTERNNIREEG